MLSPFQKNKFRFSTPSFVKQEKPTYPIIDLYEHLTGNPTNGKSYMKYMLVLCPFHGEKHPSLALYSQTNTYYCFSCEAHGDIYKMVMELENLDFREALDYIRNL